MGSPRLQDFIDESGRWKCIQCGDCCRTLKWQVKLFPEAAKYDRGDGTCRFLDAENRCSIYEERPHWCRINRERPALEIASSCARMRSWVDDRRLGL